MTSPVTTDKADPGTRHNIIGYARVSTRDQNPKAQEAELCAAGAAKVYVDHGESSRITARPQWQACLDYLRPGDTLVVRKLDRLAGSERILIEILHELADRGIDIRSLTEPAIDTTTPMGRALYGIVAVFAQLRVDTIRENTRRGLEYARAQGRYGGRPKALTPAKVKEAVAWREPDEHGRPKKTYQEIADLFDVSRHTIMRAIKEAENRDG